MPKTVSFLQMKIVDIYFNSYLHSLAMESLCNHYDTWDYNYVQFMKLSEMNPQIQSEGYLLRFPFYVMGKKDAHILLSPVEHPASSADVYEIGEFTIESVAVELE